MFPPKQILFPVDFSERCNAAARMVETFAGRFHSELTLMHVVESVSMGYEFPDDAIAPYDAITPAKARLDSFLVNELKDFIVKRVLVQGDPALEIVNYAHEKACDLIMLTTHGYGRFRRFILGSVAAKILHDAMCPVWTSVHAEEIAPLEKIRFRKIVCAIDLGRQSCSALKWAAEFAEEVGADLTIAHAIPTAKDIPDFYADQDWKNDLIHHAKGEIEHLQQSLGTQALVSIVADEVPAGICGCIEGLNADLLVIGRSVGDGVLGRLRTNAYAIIRQSPCPVVSV